MPVALMSLTEYESAMSRHDAGVDDIDDYGPSKSDQKREVERLQILGERLADMTAAQLDKLPLDDTLRQALLQLRQLKSHEALRRHRQYIGKLMRQVDEAPLLAALDPLRQPALQRQLSLLFQRLMASGDEALSEVLQRFPHAERHTLRQHVRLARKEAHTLAAEQADSPAAERLKTYLQQLAALAS